MKRDPRYLYALVSEAEFNEIAVGRASNLGQLWPVKGRGFRQIEGQIGVLWKEPEEDGQPVRPLALVVEPVDQRRLFARFAQVRTDLSPLSTWCHVFTSSVFNALDEPARDADLGGYEASWAGLIIAEAAVLADRNVSQLKLAACLATQSFALARTLALWPALPSTEVLQQYEALQRSVRPVASQMDRVRGNFGPLWSCLASVTVGVGASSGPFERVSNAIMALSNARLRGLGEQATLSDVFYDLPEAAFLSGLEAATAEDRLKQFDKLLMAIAAEKSQSAKRVELAFLAGYVATVAAGGSASLGLAMSVAHIIPDVAGWAYIIGGIGERVTWTGGFDGLGRLVSRELMRSFQIAEPPLADFAADEARVLADRQLSDPLVHLQIKQSRVATVALYPGVNLQVPLGDVGAEARRPPDRRPAPPAPQRQTGQADPMAAFVDALLPLIVERLQAEPQSSAQRATKPRYTPKRAQRALPLGDE